MTPAPKLALVVNSGSSSIKFGVFKVWLDAETGRPTAQATCSGQVERINVAAGSKVTLTLEAGRKLEQDTECIPDHGAALQKISALLASEARLSPSEIAVCGHRVVHGGPDFSAPAVVDDATIHAIQVNAALAPLHNPVNLMGIQVARDTFKDCQHVAVFDTAFHATMPPSAFRYAVPKNLYEDYKVRKYGFHGTSYKYVVEHVAAAFPNELDGDDAGVIVAHLGNGASMACVKGGKCLDTTMGLTPLEGLMMGTRCGDVDAGLCAFLARQLGWSTAEIDAALNKKSGLLGVSGVSQDMREVKQAAKNGNADAQLARDLYVERIRKYLGAFLVKLDGKLDALVFTAGVGEHDADLRERVCRGLDGLGIAVDPAKNGHKSDDLIYDVSAEGSKTKILVAKTNEEEAIAIQSAVAAGVLA